MTRSDQERFADILQAIQRCQDYEPYLRSEEVRRRAHHRQDASKAAAVDSSHQSLSIPGGSAQGAAWAVAEPPGEVVAGSDLADTGLAAVGMVLYDGEGNSYRIDAWTPDSVKPARLLANVVVTRPPDFAMSECWVRMDPGAFEAGRDLLDFSFAGHGVAISPFAVDDSALLSPQEQWQRYAGLAPGLVAGVLIGLLVLLTYWGKRPELAVYRTFGSSRAELMFLTMGEVALVLVPSVILACAATVAALAVAVSQLAVPLTGVAATLGAGLLAIGAAAASGWALGVALVPLALRGGLHEQLKDR